jgi:hypothetical protein
MTRPRHQGRRPVHEHATFASGAHWALGIAKDPMMKQIFPVVLALIPLAAVVSACVTCP